MLYLTWRVKRRRIEHTSLGKNWYEGLLERVFIFPESHDVAGVTFITRMAFLYLFWLLLIKKSLYVQNTSCERTGCF